MKLDRVEVKPLVVLKDIVPELEERETEAVDPVTRFPKESWATIVTPPDTDPAATVCAAEVITSLLADAALIVSVWVPLVKPAEATVMTGLPVVVSLK